MQIPRDRSPDSTLALLREGYDFIGNRCRRYESDVFQTRILLQKTLCLMGEEAATLFYDEKRFQRARAAPLRLQKTLLGRGGVQTLDDRDHLHRKAMFMSLMHSTAITALAKHMEYEWQVATAKWEKHERVILFDEAAEVLCRACCAWTGVPLIEAEAKERTADFVALIEGAGAIGPRHWRARRARGKTERWIAGLVEQVRAKTLTLDELRPLHVIALHRDLDGRLLDSRVAAVEIINLIRPTVAVAHYVVFVALALHAHPDCQGKIMAEADYPQLFVQEVRRYYPFFPFTNARVREDFEWRGYNFEKGTRTLLDLYGTNHDSRLWQQPYAFLPERFGNWNGSKFNFIPQGGGDHWTHHRCAGEWITIELMKVALAALVDVMDYEVPEQDLALRHSRIPARPESGFVITRVSRKNKSTPP